MAKKATGKKTTKKTSRKTAKKGAKRTTSTNQKKLDNIARQHRFIRADGAEIGSLLDLAKQLDDMAEHVFYHHVTPDRNDFANWVNDVIKDEELAQKLDQIKDKHHTTYVVMRHVVRKL